MLDVGLQAATAAYTLAAPWGTFIDTGIGGLTLTGGISWLLASQGFACDALIGAKMVTIDGDVIDVDDQHEPELLWGLRGGGGSFGVVYPSAIRTDAGAAHVRGALRFRGAGIRDVIMRAFEIEATAPTSLSWRSWRGAQRTARRGSRSTSLGAVTQRPGRPPSALLPITKPYSSRM
jgi:FAD/FMN-containing dehydrogenase